MHRKVIFTGPRFVEILEILLPERIIRYVTLPYLSRLKVIRAGKNRVKLKLSGAIAS